MASDHERGWLAGAAACRAVYEREEHFLRLHVMDVRLNYPGDQLAGNDQRGAASSPPHQEAAGQALATLIEYAEEVMQWHRDPGSPSYNECEKPGEECSWCSSVAAAISTLRTPESAAPQVVPNASPELTASVTPTTFSEPAVAAPSAVEELGLSETPENPLTPFGQLALRHASELDELRPLKRRLEALEKALDGYGWQSHVTDIRLSAAQIEKEAK